MNVIIAPSMLSCDFAKLADESKRMVEAGADCLHLDVMDGHFVPNLTMGAPVVKCLRPHTKAMFDCHLMVSDPAKWVDDFAEAGADMYTFHIEAAPGEAAFKLCDTIRKKGMKCGVALKPKTSLSEVLPLLKADKVDMVLIMTVEPGFGGQAFMADMMPKVAELRKLYPNLDIEVDGGVSVSTVDECTKAGANVIVSGSGVFKHDSPKEAIEIMRKSVQAHVLKKKDSK